MRFTFHLAAAMAATLTATAVAAAQTGNGAPSGSHFNLNIIGVSHDKNPNMNGNGSGNVIFVDLGSRTGDAVTTKILLSQAADGVFEVLDKNGTDGEASFALPVPGTYTVWARALGTPGGQSKIATCATFVDPTTGVSSILCSTDNEVFVRGTGKSSFRNVTSALTTITLVAGSPAELACGTPSVSLFATCLQDFLWQYDNNGLKLLQIRFYPS
ncbi:MAG TPA: hypothetical protein VN953_10595 [Gemmatimonadales bacterium]|nr:hypothetical protein [Gemmatimonadales bacterium]